MAESIEPRLAAGLAQLGLSLAPGQVQALLKLVDALAEWNTRVNLTAIRSPADMVDKHLLDSLSTQPLLHGRRVADIGTGAGFPGLPLAIVNPRRSFTLIEATGKKCLFVRHAVELLGIGNVEVIQARAENWKPRAPFDCVIARALGKLADFVRVAGHRPVHRRASKPADDWSNISIEGDEERAQRSSPPAPHTTWQTPHPASVASFAAGAVFAILSLAAIGYVVHQYM